MARYVAAAAATMAATAAAAQQVRTAGALLWPDGLHEGEHAEDFNAVAAANWYCMTAYAAMAAAPAAATAAAKQQQQARTARGVLVWPDGLHEGEPAEALWFHQFGFQCSCCCKLVLHDSICSNGSSASSSNSSSSSNNNKQQLLVVRLYGLMGYMKVKLVMLLLLL
jgi:hypothetical protein